MIYSKLRSWWNIIEGSQKISECTISLNPISSNTSLKKNVQFILNNHKDTFTLRNWNQSYCVEEERCNIAEFFQNFSLNMRRETTRANFKPNPYFLQYYLWEYKIWKSQKHRNMKKETQQKRKNFTFLFDLWNLNTLL